LVVNNAVLTQDNLTQENLLQEELTKEASSNDELAILREMKEKKPEFSSRMFPLFDSNEWRAVWLFLAPVIAFVGTVTCVALKTTIVPPLVIILLTALTVLGMFRDVVQYRYFRRSAPAYYATVIDVTKPVPTVDGRSNPDGMSTKRTSSQNPGSASTKWISSKNLDDTYIKKVLPKMKALVSKNGCGVLAEFRVPEYVDPVMYPMGTKVVVQMLGNDAVLCENAAGEAVHPMTDVRGQHRYDLQGNEELFRELRTQKAASTGDVLPLSKAKPGQAGFLFGMLLVSMKYIAGLNSVGLLSRPAALVLSLSTVPLFGLWVLISRAIFFRNAREYNATVISVVTEYGNLDDEGTPYRETRMKALVYMADREALVSFLVEDGISELTHPAGTLVRVRVLKGKYVLVRK
jgi:hypothetical protein